MKGRAINSFSKSIKVKDIHFESVVHADDDLTVVRPATWKSHRCAVKVVPPGLKKLFDTETKILEALSLTKSDNIVKYYGKISKPHYFILLEWIPNDLDGILCGTRNLPWRLRFSIMSDISHGVQFMHNLDILHRDIKPENVLVTSNLQAKLCDFGISTFIKDLDKVKWNAGTCGMTAPEVDSGKKPGKKSDIYSLGMTFWEVASRDEAFKGVPNHFLINELKLTGEPEKIPIGCPDGVAKLIKWCWQVRPAKRPGIDKVIESLDEAIQVNEQTKKL